MTDSELLSKARKVVDSCETEEQYKTAYQYLKRVMHRVKQGNRWYVYLLQTLAIKGMLPIM